MDTEEDNISTTFLSYVTRCKINKLDIVQLHQLNCVRLKTLYLPHTLYAIYFCSRACMQDTLSLRAWPAECVR